MEAIGNLIIIIINNLQLQNYLYALLVFFFLVFNLYLDLILINIILSWIPSVYNIKFFRGLRKVTDAYMGFFRGYLTVGFFDLTPIIGILIYEGFLYAFQYLVFM